MTLFDLEPHDLLPYDGPAMFFECVLDLATQEDTTRRLLAEIPWESHTIRMFGKDYPQPRLVAWFGDVGSEYSYSGLKMNVREWMEPVSLLKQVVENRVGERFNSVLLNLYRNGDDKVGWHSDNERELGPQPIIASLSLGATRRFKFRHRESREVVSAELPSGSLVVMSGLSQACWEHEVPKQAGIQEPRINLTFRQVMAVGA